MNKTYLLGLALVMPLITGCASFDRQDRFLLGEATRQNIALQSVRDPDAPNHDKVEGQSGERAVLAVQRLNKGETTPLDSVDTSGITGS